MRVNKQITVGAAPINIISESIAPCIAQDGRKPLSRLFVQMAAGSTGIGYVLTAVPLGVAGDITNPYHVTAQLSPAVDPGPGSSYTDTASQSNGSAGVEIDARGIWVHSSVAGDKIIVSFDQKV